MQSGREPGCCFECQSWVFFTAVISGGSTYTVANATKIWPRSFIVTICRRRACPGCRELRNEAARGRLAEVLTVANV